MKIVIKRKKKKGVILFYFLEQGVEKVKVMKTPWLKIN